MKWHDEFWTSSPPLPHLDTTPVDRPPLSLISDILPSYSPPERLRLILHPSSFSLHSSTLYFHILLPSSPLLYISVSSSTPALFSSPSSAPHPHILPHPLIILVLPPPTPYSLPSPSPPWFSGSASRDTKMRGKKRCLAASSFAAVVRRFRHKKSGLFIPPRWSPRPRITYRKTK
ncbi:hypothetical protein E2C01_081995 [Portunus trituberculatus]|uniref:Uncharacterized protein n=1 Tax=Portunus trituberculatus TaxID=210409 RepID=A0A5B7IY32_PORTR|nr:hypothetical protein [Portunus trituberculatus]